MRFGSGHFQIRIWKLTIALYGVVFAEHKIGTDSVIKVNMTSYVNKPNLLWVGNLTFVVGYGNEFSVFGLIVCFPIDF